MNGVVFIDRWHLRLPVAVYDTSYSQTNEMRVREWYFARENGGEVATAEWRDEHSYQAPLGINVNARTQRYGEVTSYGTAANGSLDQTFSAKWITDLAWSQSLLRRYPLTLGVDNIADIYPDRNNNPGDYRTTNGGNANFGIFPYSGITPFGFNGRFVYARVSAIAGPATG